MFLNGNGITEADSRGEPVTDDSFLLCLNAHHEDIEVTLPPPEYGTGWAIVVDTAVGEVLTLTTVPGVVGGPAAGPGRGEASGAGPLGRGVPADRDHDVVIPSSTYRIQFSAETTLQQGAELAPYLDALGVGAVYASPLLASGKGSNHGYDVVDPTRAFAARAGATRGGAPSSRRRAHAAWGSCSTSCRTRRCGRRQGEPVVVGRAHPRPGLAIRVVLRHQLGGRPDPAAGSAALSPTRTTRRR